MTTTTVRSFGLCLAAAALLAFSPSTNAATIIYGDFSGASVDYLGVQESSVTDPVPLFGAPTVVGNVIDFNPVGFAATATGGGIDLTDGQLDMSIRAKPTYAVDRVVFSEAGDFSLIGIGTANTYVQVTANFFVDIMQVDGVNLGSPVSFTTQMQFVPVTSGIFTLPANPGAGQLWNGSITLDLAQALDDAGVSYTLGATLVKVNLDNQLVALSESGTYSYIAKKDFKGFSVTTFTVPEPSSFALLLLGGLGLFFRRNR